MLYFHKKVSFVKTQYEETLTATNVHINAPEIQPKNVVLTDFPMFT